MLLSVPLMAFFKISLFSDMVPPSYRDPILVFLEGDTDAPRRHRSYQEQHAQNLLSQQLQL